MLSPHIPGVDYEWSLNGRCALREQAGGKRVEGVAREGNLNVR